MKLTATRLVPLSAALTVLAICSASYSAGSKAFTRPSEDRMLSFVADGRVAEVLVKEGQTVRQGQILAKLDDEEEQLAARIAEARASNDTPILAAKAKLEQGRTLLEKSRDLYERSRAVSIWELKEAEVNVAVLELDLKMQEFLHTQRSMEHKVAQAQLRRKRIASPIAGTVEEIHIEPGESVRALTDAIRIVKIEPLRVEAAVPLAEALPLELGQSADVSFVTDPPLTVKGKITHIGSVADYASYTLTVHVELPDGLNRPAGEEVTVIFAPPAAKTEDTGPGRSPTGQEDKSTAQQAKKE